MISYEVKNRNNLKGDVAGFSFGKIINSSKF